MNVAPGQTFSATTEAGDFPTGLVGTITVEVVRNSDGHVMSGPATSGIIELVAASGIYSATALVAPTTLGQYTIFWGAGALVASEDLVVTYSQLATSSASGYDLTTLAQAKNWLGITDTTQDSRLQQLITAASKAVMEYAQREFAPVTASATRTFALKRDGLITFGNGDLQSVSQVQIDTEAGGSPTTLTSDQYQLWPIDAPHGVYRGIRFYTFAVGPVLRQWFGLYRHFSVTGAWGFASVPTDVEQATLITVAKWFKRDETAWSNELPYPNTSTGNELPLDAIRLVQSYKRIV